MLAFRKSGSVVPRGLLDDGGDGPYGSDITTSVSSSSAEDEDAKEAKGPCASDERAALDFAGSGDGDLGAPPLRPDDSAASPTMFG